MTGPVMRLHEGGRIDRTRRLGFSFNGRKLHGYAGDTLASALLANGVHLVGRSFKYHRPRGILSAGVEEPSALIQLGDAADRTDPNMRATQVELFEGLSARSQNAWPVVEADVGVINDVLSPFFPAGFYYKTFMGPGKAWMQYERVIRSAAGLGRSPSEPDPDIYDQKWMTVDVLVVGGGAAGLAAARAAGQAGARVMLVDEQAELGGWLLSESPDRLIDGQPAADWLRETVAAVQSMPEVTVLPRTTAFGYYTQNFVGALERVSDHLPPGSARPGVPRQRLWKIRAREVVLAAGAIERHLAFPDNDRPGIMLAGAGRAYLGRYAVKVGDRVLVFANNDSAYQSASALAAANVQVMGVVDTRPAPGAGAMAAMADAGIPVWSGHTVVGTRGRSQVREARAMRLTPDGKSVVPGAEVVVACDALLMSGGWTPSTHLFSHARGTVRFDDEIGAFVPDRAPSAQAVQVVGAANGVFSLGGALSEGGLAGARAARQAGFDGPDPVAPAVDDPAEAPARHLWLLPSAQSDKPGRVFVDYQNDVAAKDLKLALREGYVSVEHVKRYTTTGMGTDQGKIGNVTALGIVADTLNLSIPSIGATTYRPPYSPVTFGAIAGRTVGSLYDPIRRTPMHVWHQANGAAFENVGQWKRAWYYPRAGEEMHDAVNREVKAAREALGIFDGSTLGKIDIQGPDAAEFLNRVYTNAWLKLGVGRCRYGLMLGEDGMVMDDGVTSRLGDNHFHMTTTTGGAAAVMAWLENWLQTEWPELKVYLTSVTEQWAVISLCGQKARDVLDGLVEGIDLSAEAFPHMSVRAGRICGVPLRLFRISFTGELGFEINVPASHGLDVWQAVMKAGEAHGITPYGTETMHVLRAEKGFIIVGQETDGTVTPQDLGMDWIVSKKKDFIGRRSLSRSDTAREGRKQLVGLLTQDPAVLLEEGAHLIGTDTISAPPVPMLGHVTSSYHSPNVGRSIALAMLKDGRNRMGQTLYVAMPDNRTIPVSVVKPVFFDPEGTRQNG